LGGGGGGTPGIITAPILSARKPETCHTENLFGHTVYIRHNRS
jgi:hypothetical protein